VSNNGFSTEINATVKLTRERFENAGVSVGEVPSVASVATAEFGANVRSKAFFESAISNEWRKNVASIVQTGKLLSQAKDELDHDIFAALKVPFEPRVSQMLRRIATNVVLSDPANFSSLPPCWRTLYELTKLSDDHLRAALTDGRIHPRLKQKEARALLGGLLPARSKAPKTNGQAEKPLDPVAVWKAFSPIDKRAILDAEGRIVLATLLSQELMIDLLDHLIRQEMTGASTKPKPAVSLTKILRTALDPANSGGGGFEPFKAKLKGLGLDLHDVSIALRKESKGGKHQ